MVRRRTSPTKFGSVAETPHELLAIADKSVYDDWSKHNIAYNTVFI